MAAGDVVTASHYTTVGLTNTNPVIDKYQTGALAHTCNSLTDAISD